MNALNKLPRKAFYAVPERAQFLSEIECDSLVMLPQGVRLHDSGYRLMDAVAVKGEELLCRVSGSSDVFHLCAPSDIWTKERTPSRASAWGMDCLARSGLLRIFLFDADLRIGDALSSLYIHPLIRSPTTCPATTS